MCCVNDFNLLQDSLKTCKAWQAINKLEEMDKEFYDMLQDKSRDSNDKMDLEDTMDVDNNDDNSGTVEDLYKYADKNEYNDDSNIPRWAIVKEVHKSLNAKVVPSSNNDSGAMHMNNNNRNITTNAELEVDDDTLLPGLVEGSEAPAIEYRRGKRVRVEQKGYNAYWAF
jgi:hypothetical protein